MAGRNANEKLGMLRFEAYWRHSRWVSRRRMFFGLEGSDRERRWGGALAEMCLELTHTQFDVQSLFREEHATLKSAFSRATSPIVANLRLPTLRPPLTRRTDSPHTPASICREFSMGQKPWLAPEINGKRPAMPYFSL